MTIASSIFELQQLQPQRKQEKISKKILWDIRKPQWGCITFADGSEKQVSQEIENEFPRRRKSIASADAQNFFRRRAKKNVYFLAFLRT